MLPSALAQLSLPSRTETLPNQSSEDPPARSLADDPQNMVRDGFETIPLALQLLGPYVAHCHIGAHEPTRGELDENGQRQWVWRRTGMGEGLYDIPMMIKCLKVIALSVSCVCVSLSLSACVCLSLASPVLPSSSAPRTQLNPCCPVQDMDYDGFISLEDLGGADARGAITPEEKAAEGIAYLKRVSGQEDAAPKL